jgi:hypothetical protein
MDALLAEYDRGDPWKIPAPPRTAPLVVEHLYAPDNATPAPFTRESFGVSLGYRRKAFSGTDALGMSVNPQACAWAALGARDFEQVWGEGARLANKAFLMALHGSTDLTVVELVAPGRILDERCAQRGSEQSLSWRQGAGTRAANLSSQLMMLGVRVVTIDAARPAADVERDVRERLSEVGW